MALTQAQITAKNFREFSKRLAPYLIANKAQSGYTPIGTIILLMGNTAPDYYLKCDGTVYNISAYPELANYFEAQLGSKNFYGGDGTTTFAVPSFAVFNTPNPGTIEPIVCIATVNIFLEANSADSFSYEECVIGTWVDGKPLYQKTLTGSTISGTSGAIATGLIGIDYVELVDFQCSMGTYRKNLLDSVSIKTDGTEIYMVADPDSYFRNQTYYATVRYTKTDL